MLRLHFTPNTTPTVAIGPRLLLVMKPPYYFTTELYGSATVLSVSGESLGTREEFIERTMKFISGLELKSNIDEDGGLSECQSDIDYLVNDKTHDIFFPMRDETDDIPALLDLLTRKGRARSVMDNRHFYFELSVGYIEPADDLAGELNKSL